MSVIDCLTSDFIIVVVICCVEIFVKIVFVDGHGCGARSLRLTILRTQQFIHTFNFLGETASTKSGGADKLSPVANVSRRLRKLLKNARLFILSQLGFNELVQAFSFFRRNLHGFVITAFTK